MGVHVCAGEGILRGDKPCRPCPCEAAIYNAEMINKRRERRSKQLWAGSTRSYKTIGQLIVACPLILHLLVAHIDGDYC